MNKQIKPFEPDGIKMFDEGLPSRPLFSGKKKEPRIPRDLSIALIITMGVAFVIMPWLSIRINWNTSKILDLSDKVYAIETRMPKLDIAAIVVTPTPKPTLTPAPENHGLFIPPEASAFKTWMDYRKISDRSSAQWKLQQLCETNALGFRTYDGCYIVAVGSFYSNRIGKRLVITFDTGESIQAIVGDVKRDEDVIDGQYHEDNGNLIEFIVDKQVMDKKVLNCGDVSSLGLAGKVIEILEVG